MRKFVNQLIASWHHGKGYKFTKKGNHGAALHHFQLALNHAIKSEDQAKVALEIECVARTYLRLGDYFNARLHAEKCYHLYEKLENYGPVIVDALKRVTELLQFLEQKKEKGVRH